MHQLRHQNQVRSACERCRKQKLRCSRPTTPSASCSRCSNLGLVCQTGTQRKVGRPTKPNTLVGRTISTNEIDEPALSTPEGDFQTEQELLNIDDSTFLQDLPERVHDDKILNSMDWILPDDPGFLLDSPTSSDIPGAGVSGSSFNIEPMEPSPTPPLESSTIIHITSGNHFSSLSRINKELHDFSETMSRQLSKGTLESFVLDMLGPNNTVIKLKPYQHIMKLSQDYLQAIKSLHTSLDKKSKVVPLAQSPSTRQACFALNFNPPSTSPPSMGSACCMTVSRLESSASDRTILDSPTALLVISCFSQLLQHLEAIFTVSQARLSQSSGHMFSPANEGFAGVLILDFLTQGAMFAEMIRNVFGQIIVVLGLPTVGWWAGKSAWTGLLREKRYRDMLNQELGSVENGWSTRPSKVMELIDSCKTMITDASMMGY